MARAEVIHKRLNKLDEYLAILRKLQRYDLDEFIARPEYYGSTMRFLQLAIESLMQLGTTVIADLGLGTVNYCYDIPLILTESGYINVSQVKQFTQLIGLRNVLVHDYMDIDLKSFYSFLEDDLMSIEELRRVFAQFL